MSLNMATGFTQPRSPLVRWSPSLTKLSALSVRQPWAWLIMSGFKDIENRSWRINCPRTLLVHASLNRSASNNVEAIERRYGVLIPDDLHFGAVVGVVDVVDCVKRHPSKWFEPGGFGWVLANSRRLKPRSCKGAVGLFRPECSDDERSFAGRPAVVRHQIRWLGKRCEIGAMTRIFPCREWDSA
jgi:hypothetical protein